MVSFKKETKKERKIRKEDETLDKFLDGCVNKYYTYYPIEKCIQDKDTPNKKKHSMCTYCYSCYVELCESIKEGFNISINNKGEWTSDCLKKICSKALIKNMVIDDNWREIHSLVETNIMSIINILNKYTNYSSIKKEGHNLLHRESMERFIGSIKNMFEKYNTIRDFEFKQMFNKKYLRSSVLININIICYEVYCVCCYFKYGFVLRSKKLLYDMIYEKNRRLSLLNTTLQ
jgi:hypothetical protein